jgi:hypothetical protein
MDRHVASLLAMTNKRGFIVFTTRRGLPQSASLLRNDKLEFISSPAATKQSSWNSPIV